MSTKPGATLNELKEALDTAKEVVSDAQDALTAYLAPYIKAAHGLARMPGDYHDMYTSRGTVYITLRWEGTGGPYDYVYELPLSVFDQEDAEAAAWALFEAKQAKMQAAERARELAQYEQLGRKLGKI